MKETSHILKFAGGSEIFHGEGRWQEYFHNSKIKGVKRVVPTNLSAAALAEAFFWRLKKPGKRLNFVCGRPAVEITRREDRCRSLIRESWFARSRPGYRNWLRTSSEARTGARRIFIVQLR